MIRKGFTDEVMFVIGLEDTMDKVVLVVGATPTAWGRFWSGLVYQGKGNLLGCYIGFIQEVQVFTILWDLSQDLYHFPRSRTEL